MSGSGIPPTPSPSQLESKESCPRTGSKEPQLLSKNSTCCCRLMAISSDTCHKIFLPFCPVFSSFRLFAFSFSFCLFFYFNQKWKLNAANEDFNCVQRRNEVACGFCGRRASTTTISINVCTYMYIYVLA